MCPSVSDKTQLVEQISNDIYGLIEERIHRAFEMGYDAGREQAEAELKKGIVVYARLHARRWEARIDFSADTEQIEKDMRFIRQELGLVEDKRWPDSFESDEVRIIVLPLAEESMDAYYRIGSSKIQGKGSE